MMVIMMILVVVVVIANDEAFSMKHVLVFLETGAFRNYRIFVVTIMSLVDIEKSSR